MVVAALFEQFNPSNRGLLRDETATEVNARAWYNSSAYDNREYRHLPILGDLNDSTRSNSNQPSFQTPRISTPATKQRKKGFRATKFLASVAADLDLVTDWIFYFHTVSNDRQYRATFAENPAAGADPYLVPPALLWTVLAVCILGTGMWLILATDGAIVAPVLRLFHIDKLSMGCALFLCVLLEDIPQVILTCFVEDYYEGNHEFNSFALVSIVASLYDTLIKLAEAFDERDDMVETGVWCKESLWAHKKTVTAVVPLPVPCQDKSAFLPDCNSSRVHVPVQPTVNGWSMMNGARQIVADTKLPRLRFLSTSMDKTIRLWDTAAQIPGHRREKCTRNIRGHLKGVTCIAFLGEISNDPTGIRRGGLKSSLQEEAEEANSYFLAGSEDGKVKLWNLRGKCMRMFFPTDEKNTTVTSITHVNRDETFASAYNCGAVRLWDIWSGKCIAEYRGHTEAVNSVCSLEDTCSFLSASDDGTIRLWDTSTAIAVHDNKEDDNLQDMPQERLTIISDKTAHVEKVSSRTFIGHSGAVLSVACVDPGVALLSGSQDATARLWSIESGNCLRIFVGHTGPVTTVAVVDAVTVLTGSQDTSIKIWDAFSAACIRTYSGHTGAVTSVAMAEKGTFISASEDQTIKLWIFTAVLPMAPSDGTLNEMLSRNDHICMA